jgi:ADP-heptose:LPS heptosyltransferase
MLCAVPALRALRRARPHDHIVLVGLPWARIFAQRFARYLDEFVEFPGHPALPERTADAASLRAFLAGMRARKLDLALQMHGSGGVTNAIVAEFGARRMAGFRRLDEPAPPGGEYVDWRERENEVERGLRLLAAAGVPACGTALEFPLEDGDTLELESLQRELGFEAVGAVCVHPGATLRSRRWPPERFAAVGDALHACGMPVVLTGSFAEIPLCERVARAMRRRPVNLAGRTTLGGLAALIARARLLVCNDTGVSHLAAAFGTRSVVVCSGADPARWSPLDRERHHVFWHPVACRPCMHEECPVGHPCALGVPAEAVGAKALELLRCAA